MIMFVLKFNISPSCNTRSFWAFMETFVCLNFSVTAKCNVFNTVLTCDWEPAVRLYFAS